jgi:hypothetical protein
MTASVSVEIDAPRVPEMHLEYSSIVKDSNPKINAAAQRWIYLLHEEVHLSVDVPLTC